MIDTNSLEWKLRKWGEAMDMLKHTMYSGRNKKFFDSVGRSQRPWLYRKD